MLQDFYDIETEPVVQLSAFYGEPKHLVEKCLIIFSKEIHDHLLHRYACKEIGLITACNGNTSIFSFRTEEGEEIAFYLSGIGSAVASGNCYEVHWQTGAKAVPFTMLRHQSIWISRMERNWQRSFRSWASQLSRGASGRPIPC